MQGNQSREDLSRIAHARLYPSLTASSYLVLRRRREIFRRWMQEIRGNHLAVLDLGGRYQPYRPLLGNRIRSYFSLDLFRTLVVDVVGDAQQLPFSSESLDLVISTAVFDFLPRPHQAVAEVHRVLKPGGHLMMSVASIYPRAVNEECWRFLPAGLAQLLASFAKVEIVPEVGSIGGFLRLVATSMEIFAKYDFLRWILRHTAIPLLNVAGVLLDRDSISKNDQIAGNYSVLAQK